MPDEKTRCNQYDHIPEPYDIAFWRCKTCDAELVFIEERKLIEMSELINQITNHA